MAEEETQWGGRLWAAADLVTPVAGSRSIIEMSPSH